MHAYVHGEERREFVVASKEIDGDKIELSLLLVKAEKHTCHAR